MFFSLITATLGRVDEVRTLCQSLVNQTFKDFELYIVDQNEHHILEDVVREFNNELNVHYIRNNQKGLSLNRNIALSLAKAEIVGFPDDDCYYSPHTLEYVYKTFQENKDALFVATSTYDSITKQLQRTTSKCRIYKKDILKVCISYNIFLRRTNAARFDERLGVGTYFSSGEETDYLYSNLRTPNDYGIFCNSASVYHPRIQNVSCEKIYRYSLGFAALQKKDWRIRKDTHALIVFLYYTLRAFCGMLLIRNFKVHWNSFAGKIVGFIKFKV